MNGMTWERGAARPEIEQLEPRLLLDATPTSLDDGLVSRWTLDGHLSDVIADNDGTFLGGGVSYDAGWSGEAVSFDGSDDRVVAGSIGVPVGSAPRTISAWVKHDTTSGDHYIAGWGPGGGAGQDPDGTSFYLNTYDDNLRLVGIGRDLAPAAPVQPGRWYHMAASYDGAAARLYLNGIEVANGNMAYNTFSTDVFIGTRASLLAPCFFDGLIDDVRIWDRALDPSEVQELYSTVFEWAGEIDLGYTPGGLEVADLDDDDLADLIVGDDNSKSIETYTNQAGAGFLPPDPLPNSGECTSHAYFLVADFDNNGQVDIAAADHRGGSTVTVYMREDDGSTWRADGPYDVGSMPVDLAAGYFNDDELLDLAVTCGGNRIDVLLGDAMEGFVSSGETYAAGLLPYPLFADDFDGNDAGGYPDLVAYNWFSDSVTIWHGEGDGTFGNSETFSVASGWHDLGLGDFDGDGESDLVITGVGEPGVVVIYQQPGGGLDLSHRQELQGVPPLTYVAVADFDKDGNDDFAATAGDRVLVFLADGNRGWREPFSVAAGDPPHRVSVGDVNGDGWPDLAVTSLSGSITVWHNRYGEGVSLTLDLDEPGVLPVYRPGETVTVRLRAHNSGTAVPGLVTLNVFNAEFEWPETWPDEDPSKIYDSHTVLPYPEDRGTNDALGQGETEYFEFTFTIPGDPIVLGEYRIVAAIRDATYDLDDELVFNDPAVILDTTGPGTSTGDWPEAAYLPAFIVTLDLPVITDFAVNDGAPTTHSRTVTLNNTCQHNPTHYMASESPDFADTVWLPYSESPRFELSPGPGTKHVYFKVKNGDGESEFGGYDTIGLAEYVVVVSETTWNVAEWRDVAESLQTKHTGHILTYEGEPFPEALRAQVGQGTTSHVCFVAQPQEVTRAYIGSAHQMLRALDADVYGDAIWGVVTGLTAGDALALAKKSDSLAIGNALLKTASGWLEYISSGTFHSETDPSLIWTRTHGGVIDKRTDGPLDDTVPLVNALNGNEVNLMVTSGHATEKQWQLFYDPNDSSNPGPEGYFRSDNGQLYGQDNESTRHNITSKNPKVYYAPGNCLIGHIPEGSTPNDSLVLGWLKSGGAVQFAGYTVTTSYGYMGWGLADYFIKLGQRYSFAEAWHLVNQALLFDQKHVTPGIDPAALAHDRDVFVLYGDPAFNARLWQVTDPDYSQGLSCVAEAGGVRRFTLHMEMNRDVNVTKPVIARLPFPVSDVEIIHDAGRVVDVVDDMVLVQLWHAGEADLTTGQTWTVEFRATGIGVGRSDTPGPPDLLASSDTGASDQDDVTGLDNSTPDGSLQFEVSGTTPGATVVLYDGDTMIGSAAAVGDTTVVTTDGACDLTDGIHWITARQTEPLKQESYGSAALEITVDTSGPCATGILVAGPGWKQGFLDFLETEGLGSGGYSVPVGSGEQLDELPWNNVDQIKVVFSEDVDVEQGDLAVYGVDVPEYAFSGFGYDPAGFTATWTFAEPFGADKLLLVLSDDVTDAAGNALDGEWADEVSTWPSGDGTAGGDFRFRLNALAGDVDQSGEVRSSDTIKVRRKSNTVPGDPDYSCFYDVDGSGEIRSSDTIKVRRLSNTELPGGEPVVPPAAAGRIEEAAEYEYENEYEYDRRQEFRRGEAGLIAAAMRAARRRGGDRKVRSPLRADVLSLAEIVPLML